MTKDSPSSARQPQVQLRHVDLPDLKETFADSITGMFFDGQSLRINLGVTRFEQTSAASEANAHRVPACRLVLTPGAAIELANQLQQLIAKLTQSGVVRPSGNPASSRVLHSGGANSDAKKPVSEDPVRVKLDELAETIEGYMERDWLGRERK